MGAKEIATEYRLAQWAQALRERAASGESIKEFCRSRGIKRNTYFYWQRKLRETACKQLSLSQEVIERKNQPMQSFTEVRVEEPIQTAENTGLIHMEVGEARITIDSAYPLEKLAALLRELGRPC